MVCALLLREGVCYRKNMRSPLSRLVLTPVLALLMAPGCLYIGGINHDPQGEVVMESSSARLEVGGSATFNAQASDPDDDILAYEWRAEVVDDKGKAWVLTRAAGSKDTCDQDLIARDKMSAPVIGEQSSLTIDPFCKRGTYTVRLRFADDRGAALERKFTFEVKNTAPSGVRLRLRADPLLREQDQVPDHGGGYPAHAHYLVYVEKVDDLEGDLACGQGASVTWTLEHGPALIQEYKQVQSCSNKETLDRLRFRFKPAKLSGAQALTIRATINDGHGGVGKGEEVFSLLPNRPPCIKVGDLWLDQKQNVAVLSAKGHPFDADLVDDDVDAKSARHRWSVRDKGAAGFTDLPGQTGGVFQMPAWFRLPGDELELRVLVQDDLSALPTCGLTTALCAPHKALPKNCYQGITWKVRMQ